MNVQSIVPRPRPGTYDIHVVPNGDAWAVKREGEPAFLREVRTQREAISFGQYLARESAPNSLVIHGVDGRFRDVRTYR